MIGLSKYDNLFVAIPLINNSLLLKVIILPFLKYFALFQQPSKLSQLS